MNGYEPSIRREPDKTFAVGIDTIKLKLPVTAGVIDAAGPIVDHMVVDPSTGQVLRGVTRTQFMLGRRDCALTYDVRRNGAANVIVEGSVPRILRGDNNRPATVEEVDSLLGLIQALLADEYGIYVDLDQACVQRVDLVRDFENVEDMDSLLNGLSLVPGRVRTWSLRATGRQRPRGLSVVLGATPGLRGCTTRAARAVGGRCPLQLGSCASSWSYAARLCAAAG